MILPSPWRRVLDFFGTPLVIERSPGQPSGEAGLLPVRQFDDRIGLTRAFTDTPADPRDPDLTHRNFLQVVRSRVYGILAGYAEVMVTTRRIVVPLSSRWPHLGWYRRVYERLRDPLPPSVSQPSD